MGQPTAAPGAACLYPVLRGARLTRLFQAERPDLASCQGGRSSRGRAVWQKRPARVRPFRVCELALTGELLRYSLSGVRTSLGMRGQRPAPPMPSTLKLGTVVLTKLDLEYNCMRNTRGNQAVRDAVKDRSGFVLHLSLYRCGVDGAVHTVYVRACRFCARQCASWASSSTEYTEKLPFEWVMANNADKIIGCIPNIVNGHETHLLCLDAIHSCYTRRHNCRHRPFSRRGALPQRRAKDA